MACLVVTREEADLVTHELTRDVITIGSAPLNHIVIDDPGVSAQHAILARVADSYWLKDLGSTNGTQVNGVSISDAELKNGDKFNSNVCNVPQKTATTDGVLTSRSPKPSRASSGRQRESDGNGANFPTIVA